MKGVFAAILIVLLLILQYTLWLGEGGLVRVWSLNEQVAAQEQENAKLRERNKALEAEVLDLKQGLEAIEERARTDLGMIKKNETFHQVVEPTAPANK
ncbi:MAG TPA: cell division protein FtsB [Gammaproteobacteria bacterium]